MLPRPGALRARKDRIRALRGRAEARLGSAAEIQRALGRRRLVPELLEIRLVHLDDAAHRLRAHVRPRARVRGGRLRGLRSRLRSLRGLAARASPSRTPSSRSSKSTSKPSKKSRGARRLLRRRRASKRSTPSSKRSSSSGDRRESRRSSGASVPPRLLFCPWRRGSAPMPPRARRRFRPALTRFAFASSALTQKSAARSAGSPVVRYSLASSAHFCASERARRALRRARRKARLRRGNSALPRLPFAFLDCASALAAVPGGNESVLSRNGATATSYSSSSNTVSHARVYMVCGRKWQSSAPYEDASSISSSESLFSRVSRARMWYWHSAGATTPRLRHANSALLSSFSRCSSTKSEKASHVGGASRAIDGRLGVGTDSPAGRTGCATYKTNRR